MLPFSPSSIPAFASAFTTAVMVPDRLRPSLMRMVLGVAAISHHARIRELSPLFTHRGVIRALDVNPEIIDPVWPRETSPLSGLLFWFASYSDAQDTLATTTL